MFKLMSRRVRNHAVMARRRMVFLSKLMSSLLCGKETMLGWPGV